MFGPLGLPELILIFIVALLLFGPRQMPQIGRTVGRALGELRRASNDFKRTIEEEVAVEDLREVRRDLAAVGRDARNVVAPPAPSPPPAPDAGAGEPGAPSR